jgi:hypothetical protein
MDRFKAVSLAFMQLLLAAVAFAAGKYASTVYGFSVSFPGDGVAQQQVAPDIVSFSASPADQSWFGQVEIRTVNMAKVEITKKYMHARLKEIYDSEGMTPAGDAVFTTIQDYPAILQSASYLVQVVHDQDGNVGIYRGCCVFAPRTTVVVTIQVIFVQSKNRIYIVSGHAPQDADRSNIQPFLDSFKILGPWSTI